MKSLLLALDAAALASGVIIFVVFVGVAASSALVATFDMCVFM